MFDSIGTYWDIQFHEIVNAYVHVETAKYSGAATINYVMTKFMIVRVENVDQAKRKCLRGEFPTVNIEGNGRIKSIVEQNGEPSTNDDAELMKINDIADVIAGEAEKAVNV